MRRVIVAVLIVVVGSVTTVSTPVEAATQVTIDGVRVIHQGNGDLRITGTAADDTVAIWPGDVPGEVRVEIGDETAAEGVVRSLNVNLGAGDDSLTLLGRPLASIDISRNFLLRSGSGRDILSMFHTNIGGSARVDLGTTDGTEEIISIFDSNFSRNLALVGRAGPAVMAFFDNTVDGLLDVNQGQGDMNVAFHGGEYGRFRYRGSNGIDLVDFSDRAGNPLDLGHNPSVSTSGGDDQVLFQEGSSHTGILRVNSGSGDDTVTVKVATGTARVNTGAGDDHFSVRNGLPSSSRANGGQGTDTIEFLDGPPDLTHLAFENVIQPS